MLFLSTTALDLSQAYLNYHVVLPLRKSKPYVEHMWELANMHIWNHEKVGIVAWAAWLFSV